MSILGAMKGPVKPRGEKGKTWSQTPFSEILLDGDSNQIIPTLLVLSSSPVGMFLCWSGARGVRA